MVLNVRSVALIFDEALTAFARAAPNVAAFLRDECKSLLKKRSWVVGHLFLDHDGGFAQSGLS